MDLYACCSLFLVGLNLSLLFPGAVFGAKFTFVNKCEYTVWPGILSNAGSPKLQSTGFELRRGSSRTFAAPTGWSGRFWGRTGCSFSGGSGSCQTGDCGSRQVECNGAGAAPPATLAEFTLGTGGLDFYDVSLVDGYNLPMIVEATGGSGTCATTGCATDLNQLCPSELRVSSGEACRSACEAFGSPEYCCSGAYSTPNSCRPSVYSQMFKSACPKSYSYAYDDPTSTFTCAGADYTVTFCPSSPSQKSSMDPNPTATTETSATSTAGASLSGSEPISISYSGSVSGIGVPGADLGSDPEPYSHDSLVDGSMVADLAMGNAAIFLNPSFLHSWGFVVSAIFLCIFMNGN